jgi:hypothetical protein
VSAEILALQLIEFAGYADQHEDIPVWVPPTQCRRHFPLAFGWSALPSVGVRTRQLRSVNFWTDPMG